MPDDPKRQHSGVEGKEVAVKTAIDIREFQEARRDPRIKSFLKRAREYGYKLDREGRIRR